MAQTRGFVAPAAQYRMLFGKQDEARLLGRFNRQTIGGLLCLGAAMVGAVLLVTSYLFGTTRAVITTAISVAVVLAFWVVGQLARRG